MYKPSYIFLTVLCFWLISCSSQAKSPWPKNRPDNFSIFYQTSNSDSRGIGKTYKLNIKAPEGEWSFVKYTNNGKERESKKFSVSKNELNQLYLMLKKNSFQNIKMTEEKVYDRLSGSSITVHLGEKMIFKAHSGIHIIKDSSLPAYRIIIKELMSFKQMKLAKK